MIKGLLEKDVCMKWQKSSDTIYKYDDNKQAILLRVDLVSFSVLEHCVIHSPSCSSNSKTSQTF